MRYVSPLRYPGGKGPLASYLAALVRAQRPRPVIYVEPFAGGAGAALRLLLDEHVDEVIINDLDPGIAAFWRALLDQTAAFLARVRACRLTIREWHRQREVFLARPEDDLALGFATFYLNRTNRSGILHARPIGGLQQDGRWTLDLRFNRDDLADRISAIARYRDRITVREEDALKLLAEYDSRGSFVYVDPPYLGPGSDLYLNTLSWEDHERLAALLRSRHRQWMVTYDADRRVKDVLYPHQRTGSFDIAHTAAIQHVGAEFVVYSDELIVHTLRGLGTSTSRWHRRRSRKGPAPTPVA